jgi:hypothetical protein
VRSEGIKTKLILHLCGSITLFLTKKRMQLHNLLLVSFLLSRFLSVSPARTALIYAGERALFRDLQWNVFDEFIGTYTRAAKRKSDV